MKVTIFGATGTIGRFLVDQALAQGHIVTAFTRVPDRVRQTDGNLHVIMGDVRDPVAVAGAIREQDAVICALGMPLLNRDGLRATGTRNIVTAMEAAGVKLVISGHSRAVDIRCPCCGGISDDEWRMLQSIALVQAGREEKVPRLISHFLEPATVRVAQSVIVSWAQELSDSSHQLQLRPRALQKVEPNNAAAENRASFRVITNPSKMVLH